ncbi:MAG: lipopolysaccharide biosynthesis protein [Candidatus Altiarchaeota archaeon]|nr:lipopolysaccharide biosynthesis protein [Candidatus Altiarchaeota archaeon]
MTLKRKAIRSSILIFGKTLFQRGASFVSKIILARLLVPADFGLVAIASLVVNGIGLFRDIGINSALIYKKEDESATADTSFLIIWVVSIFLYLIAFMLAPFVADFFGEEVVVDIIRISALTFLLYAVGFVPMTLLEKRIKFRRYVAVELISTVVGISTMLYMAFVGFGVWSLIYGGLIGGSAGAVAVWFLTSWRPRWVFDKKIAKELIGYGKFMLGVTLAIFLIQNIDNAVIGKVIGMSMLGIYTMAYSICNLPANTVMQTINQVLFPTYSRIQDDIPKLRRGYLKVFNLVSLLVFPISSGIFILAPEFVTIVLSEKWIPAIPAIQILCFFGLFRSLAGTTGEVFKALGKPDIPFKAYSAQFLIILLLIYPFTLQFGIVGASVVVTSSILLIMLWLLFRVCKALEIKFSSLSAISVVHLLSSLVMVLIVYLIKTSLGMTLLSLVTSVLVGAIVYVSTVYVLTRGRAVSDAMEVVSALRGVRS